MNGAKYRIVLADDHSLIRKGLRTMIDQVDDCEVVGEAGNGRELLTLVRSRETRPDLVILDISMPGMNGIEAIGRLFEIEPELKILMLTMHGNIQYFYNAISAGAHGYLMKDDSDTELLKAIYAVRKGEIYVSPQLSGEVTREMITAFREHRPVPTVQLTEREREVLQLVVKGYTSRKMGEILCLSPRTIDHHRARLLRKFNMKNTVDLVKHVVRNAIVVPD